MLSLPDLIKKSEFTTETGRSVKISIPIRVIDSILLEYDTIETQSINATRRVTVIGNLKTPKDLLTGFRVEIFSNVSDMLGKTKAYIDGKIKEKSAKDAEEILTQYIFSSEYPREDVFLQLADWYLSKVILPSRAKNIPQTAICGFNIGMDYVNGEIDAKTKYDALPLIEKALELDPENEITKTFLVKLYVDIALQYSDLKVPEKGTNDAIVLLKKVLALDPKNELAITNLSIAYCNIVMENNWANPESDFKDKAIDFLEKALELDPENKTFKSHLSTAYNNLAIDYYNKKVEGKTMHDALPLYEKAFQLNPNSLNTKNNLVVTYTNIAIKYGGDKILSKKFDGVILLKKALELDPENTAVIKVLANLYNNIAWALFQQKDGGKEFGNAILYFSKALVIEPENEIARKNLSQTYTLIVLTYLKGNAESITKDEILKYIDLAIKIDPKNEKIKTLLEQGEFYAEVHH